MVRAEGGALFATFLARGMVSVGWRTARDPTALPDRAALRAAIAEAEPGIAPPSLAAGTGVVWRFVHAVEPGDDVLTYDPARRRYAVGEIASAALHDPGLRVPIAHKGHCHLRRAIWRAEVARDDLGPAARRALVPTLTLFQIRPEAAAEILALADRGPPGGATAPLAVR